MASCHTQGISSNIEDSLSVILADMPGTLVGDARGLVTWPKSTRPVEVLLEPYAAAASLVSPSIVPLRAICCGILPQSSLAWPGGIYSS